MLSQIFDHYFSQDATVQHNLDTRTHLRAYVVKYVHYVLNILRMYRIVIIGAVFFKKKLSQKVDESGVGKPESCMCSQKVEL